MTHLVFFGPGASCFQRIAVLLALDPRFEPVLVDREIENTRLTEQFPKRLHYLSCGGEDNLIHGFRLSLRRVDIEVDPVAIGAQHEHTCLRDWILWRNARLRHQIRTAFTLGTEI